MSLNILVIGGTEFFGSDIVELALEAGHHVTIFSRGNQQPGFWEHIKHIAGDRTISAELAEKLAGQEFDIVVDNIAYNDVHVKDALNVLEGRVGRYILTSSVAVYIGVNRFDMPIAEENANFDLDEEPEFTGFLRPIPEWFVGYATGKIEAEKVLTAQQKIPYTIIRPPNVMGPEDHLGRCQFYLQRLLDGQSLILTNGGLQSTQPVYRRDLARGYLLAISSEKAVNQVYNIAQEKTFRLVDWVHLAAEQLGVQPNLVSIPADVLQDSGLEYAELSGAQWTYTGTLTLDLSKVKADLGFASSPIESWTEATVQWYNNTQHGSDSPGYADRKKEVEFAHRYQEYVSQLQA